jgi:hypothetical protein
VTAVGTARLRIVPASAIRAVTITVSGLGIVGMIVGSVADNNGVAITFGLITAAAVLCLITTSAVAPPARSHAISETDAQALEAEIQALVADGADEDATRHLVRTALDIGQSRAVR